MRATRASAASRASRGQCRARGFAISAFAGQRDWNNRQKSAARGFHDIAKMRAYDALTFPILSVIAHLGIAAMASVALDMPLLANPLLVAVLCMAWTLAFAAPRAAERLGGLVRALALTVGCPLALLVVGALYAGAIERGGYAPAAQAALFAAWWHLFFALTVWALIKAHDANLWKKPLVASAIVAAVPTLIMYILTLAFVPY